MSRRWLIGCLIVSSIQLGAWVLGQGPEPAISLAAQDSGLQWGPCPPFMPETCGVAVLHGDPTKDNSDVFFKLAANTSVPEHWHTSDERMVLVAGEMSVSYRGQDTVILRPGMYAYGPAKLPHSAACLGSEPCVLFIAFGAPIDAFQTEAEKR